MIRIRSLMLTTVPLAFMLAASAHAQEVVSKNPVATAMPSSFSSEAPVSFSADSLVRDEEGGTVTARGKVEMEQDGRILKADEIIYTVATDKVVARGNVVLLDKNGDVHFADTLELNDRLRDGTVGNLKTTMKDGSRFWAETGHRVAGETTTMKDAAYTPCEPCESDPESPPAWQIKASEVRHDEKEQSIVYKNATFDVLGVPVMYMPYFSHPDGTVKQKSGFLSPSAGYKSRQGLMLTNSYYYAMSPHYDATLGMTAMTKQAPLIFGEYRRRYQNAKLKINSSFTYSDRVDDIAGVNEIKGEQLRGHVFAKGLWDINNKWRSGLDVEYASDDQYLKQYDFSNKDVLENQLFVERFSGRDYAVARLLSFQDVRILSDRTDQPSVLPEIKASFLGDPAQTLGGRWSFDVSGLGLLRNNSDQDVNRLSMETGWQRRLVSNTGLVTLVDLMAGVDGYYVHDRTPAVTGLDSEGTAVRGFAQGNVMVSYPVVKRLERAQLVVEPMASITVSPNVDSDNPKIPNEDSQDVQLDTSNLFEANRFPGEDRVEDKTHATYGLRTGIYGDQGSKGEVFIGQSYRFDKDDNPFPVGSGLSQQNSDLVGQITASYKDRYSLDYKFQLDSSAYSARRHEVALGVRQGPVELAAQYLYARPINGTTLTEDREQIAGSLTYNVTDEWRLRTRATQDLGENPGLRNALFGVDYMGQCYTLTGNLQRNLTQDSSGYSSTVLMFRVGLKNLGEISTSGINLDDRVSSSSTDSSVP